MQKSKTAKKTGKKVASKKVAKKSNSLKANKKVNESKVTTKSTKNIQSTPNVVDVIDKKDKAPKKSHELTIWLLIVSFLLIITGALGVGIYFAGKPKAAKVKIETPTIEGLTFKNQKAYIGQDYSTEISINIAKTGEYRLPAELKSVKSGNRTIANTEYTYDLADNKETANFNIPGKYIEGDIKIDLKLEIPVPPVTEYKVSLTGKDKVNLTLTGSAAYTDKTFSETISIDREKAPSKIMPDTSNDVDVKCLDNSIKFTYTLNEDKRSAKIEIQPSEIKGDITIDVTLGECQHDYSYTIKDDNRLYEVCSKCGTQVLVPDSKLQGLSGQFLMIESNENSSEINYVLHDIEDMANIVNSVPAESVLDMYFIAGKYELRGNRGGSQIEVRIHGLNNNEGEMNATILNYAIGEDGHYYYVALHGLKFKIENIIMESSFSYYDGFYFGLFSDSLICNNCRFIGKHSLYANYVEINDSTLDSSMIKDKDRESGEGFKTDYAAFVYGSSEVHFNNCNFTSLGKAIKVYNEGYTHSQVTVQKCIFNVKGEPVSNKAAVEIDSTYQTKENPFIIKIYESEFNGHHAMYNDVSNNSDIHWDEEHPEFIVDEEN